MAKKIERWNTRQALQNEIKGNMRVDISITIFFFFFPRYSRIIMLNVFLFFVFYFFSNNLENSTPSTHSSEYCLISEKTLSYPSSFLPSRRPLQTINENNQHGRQHRQTYQSRYFSGSGHSDSPPPLPLPVSQDFTRKARPTIVPMVDDVLSELCRQDKKLDMFSKGRASAKRQTRGGITTPFIRFINTVKEFTV